MSLYYTADVQSLIIRGLYDHIFFFTCSVINSKFLQFKLTSYQNLTPFMKSFRRDLRFVTCLILLQGLSLLFPNISYKITDNNRYILSFPLFFCSSMTRKSQVLILILAIILVCNNDQVSEIPWASVSLCTK